MKECYLVVGTDAGSFSMASTTGVLSVGSTALSTTVGKTYSLTVTATATGGSAPSAASDATSMVLVLAEACTCSGAAQLTALLGVLLLSALTTVSM